MCEEVRGVQQWIGTTDKRCIEWGWSRKNKRLKNRKVKRMHAGRQ
jgi:hypothetical protein